MLDKDRGKAKASKSRPKKLQPMRPSTYHLTQLSSTGSSSHAINPSPTLSPLTATSSKTTHFTPPPSMPAAQSPPLSPSSHHAMPPTQESSHTVGPAIPETNSGSIPGSSATQDTSETNTSDIRPILTLDGDGFLPSHLAANGISDIFRGHYYEAWVSWKKIPNTTREMWFGEFMKKYCICPPDGFWARKNFEKRGATLLKNILEKARKKMKRPSWIEVEVWQRLCACWESESFKKKSAVAKTNRASNNEGFGGSYHTGGSITSSQHRENLTKLHGVVPSPSNLFRHTHQRKDLTWVDKRSQHIAEKFTKEMQERTQRASKQGAPPLDELDVWCEVAGVKKGKIYGLGLESTSKTRRSRYHGSSSTSSKWMRELEELRNEREDLRNERNALWVEVASNRQQIEKTNRMLRELMRMMNFQPSQPLKGLCPKRQRAEDKEEEDD